MAETAKAPATLAGRLNRYKPDQAVNIIRMLCSQLDGDSASFHGGIWPGNIRLASDETAVLGEPCDTPVAQRPADEVEFLAPEYFWDGAKSASADVYSLALILYAMCNRGRMPFQPKNKALTDTIRSTALRRRMKGEAVPVTGKLSHALKEVLTKALSYDPEKRYISSAEFLAALNETEEAQAPTAESALPAAEETPVPAAEPEAAEAGEAPSPEAAEAPVSEAEPAAEPEELTQTPDLAEETPAPEADELDKTPDAEPEADEAEEPVPVLVDPGHRKYSVQKDFEEAMPHGRTSAIPASRRKKRPSPLIPILCVLAIGIILVVVLAVTLGSVEDSSGAAPDVTSKPYVLTPSEVEAENSDKDSADETNPEDGEEASLPEESGDAQSATETDSNLGSSSIDGMIVEPTNDVVYVTQSGAKLRSGPSTSYAVADSLPRDTELLRTGIVNGWSQVQYNESEYYISNALISSQATDSTNSDISSPAADDSDGVGTLTVASEANVRSGAGTSYKILGVAKTGTKFTITDTSSDGKWYQISFNGQTGYINRNMVTVSEMAYSATARVTGDVNVRSGPSTSNSKLGVAKAGETLTVTGIANGNWYQVSFNGQTGYVAGNYISIK